MTSWNLGILTVAACVITINVGTADKTTEKHARTIEHHEHHTNTGPAIIQKSLVMDTSEEDFRGIRNYRAFVDKSLLIKAILENQKKILITAPPRFGKSVNLSMMKRFFEILPNETAQRANRELFNGLQIEKEEDIMNTECGKYRVISLNFRTEDKLKSDYDADRFLCGVVEEAYKQHRYLVYSDKLTDNTRKYVKHWCDEIMCKNLNVTNSFFIYYALEKLAEVLVEHYGRKVMVLADEYDSVATSAMMGVENREDLRNIIHSSIGCLSVLAKGNKYVDRVIITGISYVVQQGLSTMNNVEIHKFQEESNHFSEYYGLTKEECQELLIRFNMQSHYNEVVEYYGGYAKNMLSIWSVMNYLNNEKIASYWTESCFAYDLCAAFRFTSIRSIIMPFLNETNNVYTHHNPRYFTKITFDDIYDLKELFEPSYSDKVDGWRDILFLSFLLDRGYFALVELHKLERNMKIKIPNQEIRLHFKKLLESF